MVLLFFCGIHKLPCKSKYVHCGFQKQKYSLNLVKKFKLCKYYFTIFNSIAYSKLHSFQIKQKKV